jgi:hypothetical protein
MGMIKIGFIQAYTIPGTTLTISNCFWSVGETVREYDVNSVTDLVNPKQIRQELWPYNSIDSFLSVDPNENKPLSQNTGGGKAVCWIDYYVTELNEVGMQDKLFDRIKLANVFINGVNKGKFFENAEVITVPIQEE